MVRTLLGGLLGGVAMFFIGFIFWGTPLSLIAFGRVDDATAQALQAAFVQHLAPHGTGTYPIPSPSSTLGTSLYGTGPIAIVHFTNAGFPAMDTAALIAGLVLGVICTLIMAWAVRTYAPGGSFLSRFRLIAFIALAVTAYTDLGQPVFNHAPWGYYSYLWISDLFSWLAAGAVIAWFIPQLVIPVAPAEPAKPAEPMAPAEPATPAA
jgi:hypothetical protein